MKKTLLLIAGALFGLVNMLPMPWPLRVLWMRFLYFLTLQGTRWFPGILSWTQRQNIHYQMGKQSGEDYESIVQLEQVLKRLEYQGVPPHQVGLALAQAEAAGIPYEAYGRHIVQSVLEPAAARQILQESLQAARY